MDDLISREKAINTAHSMRKVCDTDNIDDYHDLIVAALKDLPPSQRWIPCSEKLPDEDYWTGANLQHSAEVLMTVYNAEDEETIIDYGHTVDGSWYSETTDCLVPSWWKVLAWMPIPEPWRGDSICK